MSPELHALVNSLTDLQGILSSSIGPLGADKVVETEAKALLVTNSGSDLLSVLSPSTPLLSMVVQSVKGFGEQFGDGTKRLVVLLAKGLQEAIRHSPCTSTSASTISLVRGLSALQASYLDDVLQEVAAPMQLSVPLPNTTTTQPVAEAAMSQQAITSLLATHMNNKVGSSAVQYLATLLGGLLHKRLQQAGCSNDAWATVKQLSQQPPISLQPGQSVACSKVIQGVVLHQALTSPHMYTILECAQCVRFVVLDCALDAANERGAGNKQLGGSTGIAVASAEQLRGAALAQQQLLRGRLALLSQRGVNLILTTSPPSALCTFLCIEAGIALVNGLDAEEAHGLCSMADISVASSAVESALQAADIGQASRCNTLHLGRTTTGLVVELEKPGMSTLLLCAPSEGLCRQYAKLARAGLAAVAASMQQGGSMAAGALACMELVPGGCAFDAALAVRLEADVLAVKGLYSAGSKLQAGAGTHTAASSMLANLVEQHGPSVMLPAMQLLRTMALAPLTAMANTSCRLHSGGEAAGDASGLLRRSGLLQVHSLLADHREPHSCRQGAAGFVHLSSAPGLPPVVVDALRLRESLHETQAFLTGQARPVLSVLSPAAHGVLEAKGTVLALWLHAVALLIQVLRIDVVAAALPSEQVVQLPKRSASARKGFGTDSSDDEAASASSGT